MKTSNKAEYVLMTKKGKTELLKKAQNYVFVEKCESVIDLNLKIFLISQRVPSQGKYSRNEVGVSAVAETRTNVIILAIHKWHR